jgi:hypothetical protein
VFVLYPRRWEKGFCKVIEKQCILLSTWKSGEGLEASRRRIVFRTKLESSYSLKRIQSRRQRFWPGVMGFKALTIPSISRQRGCG